MQYTTESPQLTTADLANTAAGRTEQAEPELHRAEDQYAGPLLALDISQEMRTRWEAIQTEFVDDPQVSVRRADELVATAIKKLAETFAGTAPLPRLFSALAFDLRAHGPAVRPGSALRWFTAITGGLIAAGPNSPFQAARRRPLLNCRLASRCPGTRLIRAWS